MSGSEGLSFDSLNSVDLGLGPEADWSTRAHMLASGIPGQPPDGPWQAAAAQAPTVSSQRADEDQSGSGAAASGALAAVQVDADNGEGSSRGSSESRSDGSSFPSDNGPMHTSLPFSLDLEDLLALRASQRAAAGDPEAAEVLRSSGAAAALAAAAMAAGMVFADPADAQFVVGAGAGGRDGGMFFVVEDPLTDALLTASSGGLPFGRRAPAVTITELTSEDGSEDQRQAQSEVESVDADAEVPPAQPALEPVESRWKAAMGGEASGSRSIGRAWGR
ncbi:hypothetical protein GPECTOR_6g851 [Gonium pectorale]|uniref:Uncharacterized protein n=1 Tax=Gonium pectorale TaxID=33097 RepID=A0A150GVZ4_GONPE|nr:hypothetical protein GPECTOR_6g851 [Gonium pectorale]|eukprot:KXZ53933.1 hypothetical protein GPECTOR_6g851 [Gonium pectorale]